MPILIRPYAEVDIPAVRNFNRRMSPLGQPGKLVFPEHPVPAWLPKANGGGVYNEFFVALESGEVRGGYALKRQDFSFQGQTRVIGFYHHPLSEGIVDKAYVAVGAILLRNALQMEPVMYALGMEGYDRPLPKMLKAMGWSDCLVPLYFKVIHPGRFLRNMDMLRISAGRRLLMDAGAFTGAGWIGIKLAQLRRPVTATYERVTQFDRWVNPIWEGAKSAYAMTAVRDCEALRTLYPAANPHFIRLRIGDVGYAVVAEQPKNPKYGNMRVGAILDCFAVPGQARPVVAAAVRELERLGVDLIVSNQSHADWGKAFRANGFFRGPSTFIFAASKKLAELLSPFETQKDRIHLSRADGDGLYRYV
jgi:hypothetical protein